MATTVNVKLSRSSGIYRASEPVEGKIVMNSPTSISHQGIRLSVNGSVNLQDPKGSRFIESFYGAIKPISIVKKTIEVRSSGKISSGITEIPFSVNLKEDEESIVENFYETFHGKYINIKYLLTANIPRGYLHRPLTATMEFTIESDRDDLPERRSPPQMVIFNITQNTGRHQLLSEIIIGGFRVTGKIATQCSLQDPLSGELTVEASSVPIISIDIHIHRKESVLVGEKVVYQFSLIQSTQIADGDVCRNMTLPIYIPLPRLLMCPTVFAGPFSVEFNAIITISFKSKLAKAQPEYCQPSFYPWMVLQTFPLELVRTKRDQFSC